MLLNWSVFFPCERGTISWTPLARWAGFIPQRPLKIRQTSLCNCFRLLSALVAFFGVATFFFTMGQIVGMKILLSLGFVGRLPFAGIRFRITCHEGLEGRTDRTSSMLDRRGAFSGERSIARGELFHKEAFFDAIDAARLPGLESFPTMLAHEIWAEVSRFAPLPTFPAQAKDRFLFIHYYLQRTI